LKIARIFTVNEAPGTVVVAMVLAMQ
jgi:hypothetical protein